MKKYKLKPVEPEIVEVVQYVGKTVKDATTFLNEHNLPNWEILRENGTILVPVSNGLGGYSARKMSTGYYLVHDESLYYWVISQQVFESEYEEVVDNVAYLEAELAQMKEFLKMKNDPVGQIQFKQRKLEIEEELKELKNESRN